MKKDNLCIEYKDDYSSCDRTYVTLCFYHEELDPGSITKLFLIEPTWTCEKNEQKKRKIKKNGWFFSTQDLIESRDVNRHLRFLFDTFKNKEAEFDSLKDDGWTTRTSCFWVSTGRDGGPILDYRTMKRISMFKSDIHFDIWWASR